MVHLPSAFALLSHKSHCLKRKCSSTLAAETQIMSEALAEVEWFRGLFEELTNPKFSIVEWATRSRNRGLLIAARSSDAEARFPKVLSIGDAKSLYDHLRTETSGGANNRRTAIDIQIIRASMDAQGAMVRWVDHSGMYADAMTKRNGNVPFHCFRCSCGQDVFASPRNQSRWRNTNLIPRHETVHPRLILTQLRKLQWIFSIDCCLWWILG